MNNFRTLLVSALAIAAAAAITGLSGCALTPVGPVFDPPVGVAYVAPTYEMPGPGYRWAWHARYGWGWHHPEHGWHRGWR